MATTEAESFKNFGNECLKNKEFSKAIEFYSKAIELAPDNYTYYSNRSAAYASAGQYKESLVDAEMTVALNPGWAKGYSRKGAALEYLHRSTEALEAYKAGLVHEPNNSQLLASIKNIEGKEKTQSNNDMLKKMMSDPRFMKMFSDPEFMKQASQFKDDPSKILQDPNLMSNFMKYFTNPQSEPQNGTPPKEDHKEEQMKKTQTNSVPSESKPKQNSAEEEKELGNKCYFNHEFDKAISHYEKAKELNPDTIIYDLNISAVLLHQEKYEECLKLCEEMIERGRSLGESYTNIAKAYTRMGNVYTQQKNYEMAIKYYNKSLSEYRDPKVSAKLKEVEKIHKEEETKKYINPEIAEEEKKQGNSLFAKGDYPEAIKHYSEAIKRNPIDAVLYSNRAAAYTKLMEYNLCVSDCNKAIELDPKFVKSYIRKGNALLTLKDPHQAKIAYERALDIDPTNREAIVGEDKCIQMIRAMNPDKATEEALRNPEIQEILRDPSMRVILETLQNDPSSAQKYMNDPVILQKIEKLIDAGVIRVGQK